MKPTLMVMMVDNPVLALSRPGVQATHYYRGAGAYGPPTITCYLWGSGQKNSKHITIYILTLLLTKFQVWGPKTSIQAGP